MSGADEVRRRLEHWVQQVVVGLDLCPFAGAVVRPGRVRYAISDADGADQAIRDVLGEASDLLASPSSEISTTLVAFPRGLAAFEAFLDVAAEVEGALEAAGADEDLQLATFHPDYRFEGVEPDDVGNYTNRAPYPVIHLLRVDEMAEAIARHPDPLSIPETNIARLEDLGEASIRALGGLDD